MEEKFCKEGKNNREREREELFAERRIKKEELYGERRIKKIKRNCMEKEELLREREEL